MNTKHAIRLRSEGNLKPQLPGFEDLTLQCGANKLPKQIIWKESASKDL